MDKWKMKLEGEPDADIGVKNMTCNYKINPVGVDTPFPRLSWTLHSGSRGQKQTAYRIIAASTLELLENETADIWDSGKVESQKSIHVKYEGIVLVSRQKCFWKVCAWDRNDRMSGWSEPAFFEMGLLDKSDWTAKWICSPLGGTDLSKPIPAPLFRKSIVLEKKVASARVYICGLGYHELYINGSKIGEEVLSPAFTRYDRTVLYNSYDVTNAFVHGENIIGVILGNGWYNCFTQDVWDFRYAAWRHVPKLIMQLYITYGDGEELLVTSDESWKMSTGPILFDGVRNGEYYDARMEKPGWDKPGYHDGEWKPAIITKSPGGILQSAQLPPIKITGTIKPISLKEVKPGLWVYDLGQNISGWARIKVCGPAGSEITLRYSETLCQDGTVDQSHIGKFVESGEFQTDRYILKGEGIEVWEPRFTYHGFQYVQVEGFPEIPTLDSINGRVVHTALETSGEFKCSNELLNKIQHCVKWSTLTNYHGFPSDCPHREKNGWTGDAMLSAEQMLFNFNPATAYAKWLRDFKDAQRPSGQLPAIIPTGGWGYNWGSGPAWDSAVILIPWYMYVYCRDISILEEMYESMKQYVDFMSTMAENLVVDFGLGDWNPPTGGNCGYECPSAVTDTAYYFVDAGIVAKVAGILGRAEDEKAYTKLSEDIRRAFRANFLDTDTGIVSGNCQTSMACGLYQGLVNDEEKPKVFEKLIEQIELKNRHIDCGILGSKYILNVLNDLGRTDLAYEMVTQTTYPGWGHWVVQGATTLWGNWDGGGSHNHHMFSDISAWFYKALAGINPDPSEPGFKHIIIKPNCTGDLKWVRAWHQSMYGRIECNWSHEYEEFKLYVKIPVGCSATIHLPASDPEKIKESGRSLHMQSGISVIGGTKEPMVICKVNSGEYSFTF